MFFFLKNNNCELYGFNTNLSSNSLAKGKSVGKGQPKLAWKNLSFAILNSQDS